MKQKKGIVDAQLIQSIRQSLKENYGQDQYIQKIIEEIGTDEGLTRDELQVIYQAYLEVKERLYYTSLLSNLWNQIEDIQSRMNLLHVYESLEQDLVQDTQNATNSTNVINRTNAKKSAHIDYIDIDNVEHKDTIDHLKDSSSSENDINSDTVNDFQQNKSNTSKHEDIKNIKLKPIDITNVEVPHIVMELMSQVYTKVKEDIDSGNISDKPLKEEAKSLKKRESKLKSDLKKTKKNKKSKEKSKNKKVDTKFKDTKKTKKVESELKKRKCLCDKGKSCKKEKCKRYRKEYM